MFAQMSKNNDEFSLGSKVYQMRSSQRLFITFQPFDYGIIISKEKSCANRLRKILRAFSKVTGSD